MENKGIYLFKRSFTTGHSFDWKVEATPTEIQKLADLELEDWRVSSVDIELLNSENEPSHAFDSHGQLWCKMPVKI